MSDMYKRLEELQSAISAIKSAEQSIQDIRAWIYRNVFETDVRPRRFPVELDQPFQVLEESLQKAESFVADINETYTALAFKVLSGRRLNREQFHLMSACRVLNFTNKDAGLSEYDDYEVFQHFCFESDEDHAYITPGMKPLPPPVTIGETTHHSLRFRTSGLPPEEIPWDRLKPEQRLFFERYLPDVAARFKRET